MPNGFQLIHSDGTSDKNHQHQWISISYISKLVFKWNAIREAHMSQPKENWFLISGSAKNGHFTGDQKFSPNFIEFLVILLNETATNMFLVSYSNWKHISTMMSWVGTLYFIYILTVVVVVDAVNVILITQFWFEITIWIVNTLYCVTRTKTRTKFAECQIIRIDCCCSWYMLIYWIDSSGDLMSN